MGLIIEGLVKWWVSKWVCTFKMCFYSVSQFKAEHLVRLHLFFLITFSFRVVQRIRRTTHRTNSCPIDQPDVHVKVADIHLDH